MHISRLHPGFPVLDMIGVADVNTSAAEAKAAAYGLSAMPLEVLLADRRIEIIPGRTTPHNRTCHSAFSNRSTT